MTLKYLGITEQELEFRISQLPYLHVINSFSSLKKTLTPIDKLRAIAKVSQLIVDTINEFWLGITAIPKEKLQAKLALDADQMIMICMFIALRAQIVEFFAQLKLALQFATSSVRASKLGYCCTTFEVTLDQILALEQSQILPAGTA